jgi:hypothetical protein
MNRADKVDIIMESRSDWTMVDYKEAYADEWDEIPSTLEECRERMGEHIYHKYSDDLLDEIIN